MSSGRASGRSSSATTASGSRRSAPAPAPNSKHMLERRVHLFLFVKVRENWGEDRERFAAIGLDYNN